MNEGLNGEGKEVISNVTSNESNIADNLTKFYNNEELVNNNKATSLFSEKATLEQKENYTMKKLNEVEAPTTNESNPLFDFVINLKSNIINFINFKKINTDDEYSKRIEAAKGVTVLIALISGINFAFSYGENILKTIILVLPIVLLIASFLLIKKDTKKAIILGIIASILMIISLKILNIIFGIIYLIGNILLLTNKKTH